MSSNAGEEEGWHEKELDVDGTLSSPTCSSRDYID